ncbi:uncharacterized protein ccdc71 [Cynoglossus semilaevis]|uniref:uncharacterized protein ccdc71 n=1 Tax=Cynoglossus semilaevis TaxID=244447 RepID=UPI00049837E8|nr:coiled-coil domain-containing protein 71 [Cynoglossus semilaevis]
MENNVRGPVVGRPLAFTNEERRAIHSWSRISSAGQGILLDALKILSPLSCDPSNTEQLVTFLKELNEEGHKATILRSNDVYSYRSSTSQPLTQDMLKPPNRLIRPAKKRGRRPPNKRKEIHPSWSTSEKRNPRIQGVCPTELVVDHHTVVCSRTFTQPAEKMPPLQVQPCLRLTNIQGLSGGHTARLQIHTNWDSRVPPVASSKQQHPQPLSGIPLQPSHNGGGAPTKAVALFSQRNLSCPIRLDGALIGDSAPVFYVNGRVFSHTNTELTSNGWRSNGFHQESQGPMDMNNSGQQRKTWKEKNPTVWKMVKVDDTRSVAEARRKAEKILQVDLSPVIHIQPLNYLIRDFKYLKN